MTSKNILFLHQGGQLIRGSERCLLTILERMNPGVFDPVVVCNNRNFEEILRSMGIETYRMYFPEIMIDGSYHKFEWLEYLKALKTLREVAVRHRSNLIYSNSGLPCQVGLPVSRLLRLPIIVHLHAPHSIRYAWLWLFKFADEILFVSQYTKSALTKKVQLKGRVRVVYNGVDCHQRFYPVVKRDARLRHTLGIDKSQIVIGQVGSIIHRKGPDVLLKAFKIVIGRNPLVKLVFIGDGEKRTETERLASELGLSRDVLFLGEIDDTETYYKNLIDINVLASRSEAFGLSLAEAAACGLPNICSKCEGMTEVVLEGSSGLTFKNGNHFELADRLCQLVENPQKRDEMGRRGRERVLHLFSLESYVQAVYREIGALLGHSLSTASDISCTVEIAGRDQ